MSARFFLPTHGTFHSTGRQPEHTQNTTPDASFPLELYTDYDKYTHGTKIAFVFANTVVAALDILAMTVLRKTKKIPYASKLLCTGILSFDMSFIIMSTARKFIQDPTTNLAFQVVGSVSYHLSLLSVMMMSAERYLLFNYPMRYLKIVTGKLTRVLAFSTWSLYILSFAIVRYGVCYLKLKSTDVFQQAGVCNNIVVAHLGICLLLTTTISCVCNWKILKLIKSKKDSHTQGTSTSVTLRFYKSTGLVLTHLIVLLLTSVVYGCILVTVRFFDLSVLQLRLSFEGVSIINCSLDPILYILWFRECRMELVKLMAFFNRKFSSTAEEMRIEIFDIVTSEKFVRSRINEVEV